LPATQRTSPLSSAAPSSSSVGGHGQQGVSHASGLVSGYWLQPIDGVGTSVLVFETKEPADQATGYASLSDLRRLPVTQLNVDRSLRAYQDPSHTGVLVRVASEQIAVRLPEELLNELDALVARGVYESRAAAVRAGVEAITALERRQQIDRAIVAGYRRIPPTAAEHGAAGASLRDAIADESW
jgi:Arc/MetJ-type ribon-helix-helix transcriptional regulator